MSGAGEVDVADKKRAREAADGGDSSRAEPDKRIKLEPAPAAGNGASPSNAAAADGGTARSKKRRWDDALPQAAAAAATPPATTAAAVTPALSQIDLIMQQIAQRARKLNIPVTISAPTSAAAHSAAATAPPPTVKSESRQWMALRLDELGRQVDDSGQVVTVKREAELRVNQQPQPHPDSKRAKYAKAKKDKPAVEDDRTKAYFDASLPGGGKRGAGERQRREMRFVAAGTHEREAALMRRQILEREMEEATKAETKEVDEQKRRREEEERIAKEREELIIVPTTYPTIPDIEWWDAAITAPSQPPSTSSTSPPTPAVTPAATTSYLYHPVPTEALLPHILPPPKPVVLTVRERKKLRRRAKLDKVRELQEQQRQGLIPPPPPKLRLSNLMDVLVRESVAEPSEMERRVREEMRERLERHERMNKERELTTEQRKEKAKRRMREKTPAEGGLIGTLAAVYAVRRGMTSRRVRYLLDVNTAQCNLSGLAVMVRQSGDGVAGGAGGGAAAEDERNGVSVVAVEGGPKGQKRFRRLMLHRIDWKRESERVDGQDDAMHVESDDQDDSDEDEAAAMNGEGNSRECVCVWRGVVAKGVFVGFKLEVCRSAMQGRKVFGKAGVEQYWDVARAVRFVKPHDGME